MGDTNEWYGTEKNGERSGDYCKCCYGKGEFLFHSSMDEMIELYIPGFLEGNPNMSEDGARAVMRKFLPGLKYWMAQ